MKVTLYILNCNYAKYLPEAIDSALKQSYKNIEIIIIDDASSDQSLKIIYGYAERYTSLVVVSHKHNKGLIKSANVALGIASGSLIVRLDADDVLLPNAISTLVRCYQERRKNNGNAVGVFGNYIEIDSDGNFVKDVVKQSQLGGDSDFLVPVHGACTLIDKEWLLSLGGYDEEFSRQDGFFLWAQAAARGCVIFGCGQKVFKYRRHSTSLSSAWGKILDQRRAIAQKIVSNQFSAMKYDVLIPLKGSAVENSLIDFNGIVKGLREKIDKLSNIREIFVLCSSPFAAEILQKQLPQHKIRSIHRDVALEKGQISLKQSLSQVTFDVGDHTPINFVLVMTMASLIIPTESIKLLINQATIFSRFDALILGRIIHGDLYENHCGVLNESTELNSELIEDKTIIERVPGVLVVRSMLWQDFLSNKHLSVGLAEFG